MIVWGGAGINDSSFNTGGRYNPSTDSWTPRHNNPDCRRFTGVWTGSEMIVWGGYFMMQQSLFDYRRKI
jgi:hypothetical protein